MRTSHLVTVSLPPAMVRSCEKIARKQHMTRSEVMRAALRRWLEEQMALEAIHAYETEQRQGKLKQLKSLASLVS